MAEGSDDRPLLTFYGDDFTGSTDVLEALSTAGIATMLFMAPPGPDVLKRYPGLRAIGVAGVSRSRSPEWMARELPGLFAALKALRGRICHYKTCSTFDSSPEVGSIGKAIEIGQDTFGSHCVPVVVGVPNHRRYVVFGNLFASAGEDVFRIDRHPTMSRHPTTPMGEADLVHHLSAQTGRPVAGFDFVSLLAPESQAAYRAMRRTARIAVIDTFDEATADAAGRLIWHESDSGSTFVAGSSGVEYALIGHLRASGFLAPAPPAHAALPSDQILVASGSCSPVTGGQIEWAEANGYASIALDGESLLNGEKGRDRVVKTTLQALGEGRSAVLHTATGPADPRIASTRQALERRGLRATDSAEILGGALGLIVRDIAQESDVNRMVLAGGDSTGHAARALDFEALEMVAPLVPGSPLCRVRGGGRLDGLELVMKGGQVGDPDCFAAVQRGRM